MLDPDRKVSLSKIACENSDNNLPDWFRSTRPSHVTNEYDKIKGE